MLKVRLPGNPLERANPVKNLFGRINFKTKLNAFLFTVAIVLVIPFAFIGLTLQAFLGVGLLALLLVAYFLDPVDPAVGEARKVEKRATYIFEILTQGSVVMSIAVAVGVFNTLSAYSGVSVYAIAVALVTGLGTMFVIATAPEKA